MKKSPYKKILYILKISISIKKIHFANIVQQYFQNKRLIEKIISVQHALRVCFIAGFMIFMIFVLGKDIHSWREDKRNEEKSNKMTCPLNPTHRIFLL